MVVNPKQRKRVKYLLTRKENKVGDLNVTEGEWVVTKGFALRQYAVRSSKQYTITGEFDNKHNAYLFAQAKNMYEELKGLSEMFRHEHNGDGIADDIDKLLNACKPPEER